MKTFTRYLLATLGIVSTILGILGIFLPVLPTTPFLLLSATLFARSSKRLHDRLINHKVFGKYIGNFLKYKTIPLKVKIYAITVLWITILCSVFFAVNGKIWLQIILIAVAAGVTLHILSYKTGKKD